MENLREDNRVSDEVLAKIAIQSLGIETLDTRNCDSLDFHDCAVWSIKKALQEAYEAGRRSNI